METIFRRSLLCGGLMSLCAGCMLSSNKAIELGTVVLENPTDEPQRIELEVFENGTRVHSSIHELTEPEGGDTTYSLPDCDWSASRSQFEIKARRENSEWESFDVPHIDHENCVAVRIRPSPSWSNEDVEFSPHPCDEIVESMNCER